MRRITKKGSDFGRGLSLTALHRAIDRDARIVETLEGVGADDDNDAVTIEFDSEPAAATLVAVDEIVADHDGQEPVVVTLIHRTPVKIDDLPAPDITHQGCSSFVLDEASGAVPVYCDGVAWRRYSDNAIVAKARA